MQERFSPKRFLSESISHGILLKCCNVHWWATADDKFLAAAILKGYGLPVPETQAVFSKSGDVLFGPVAINTLWSGFGGLCQADNDGDPIVRYDRMADRWVIMQLAVTGADGGNAPFLVCVAVSTGGDPTGSFNRYSFSYAAFPDYPKLSVWMPPSNRPDPWAHCTAYQFS